MEGKNSMSKKFIAGVLFGSIAGFMAGMLTAPKSGKETRAELMTKAEEVKAEAMKRAKMAYKDAATAKQEFMQKAEEKSEEFQGKAEDLKDRTERAYEGAKKGFFERDRKEK